MLKILHAIISSLFIVIGLATPPPGHAPPLLGLVLTPGGQQDSANVHIVPDRARITRVVSEIHVFHENGTLFKTVPVTNAGPPSNVTRRVAPAASGWITYAYWYKTTGDPIAWFETDFVVPPAPASCTGQTVFLFPGIEPASGTSIVQPVLQYGPSSIGGGNFWVIACWYVVGTQYFATKLSQVPVGLALRGLIDLEYVATPTDWSYWVGMYVAGGDIGMRIDSPEELVWATLTLEAYNIVGPQSYPAGPTTFSDVLIRVGDWEWDDPGSSWSVVNDATEGITTNVVVNSMSDGVVVIDY
ncbi:hypothetical protein MIND_01173600 [Mycena indigotica]|uniref:Uncharacterized protein n=1 Tax=Mycena indigotica TaxID=2126181 RepID=A0A8H6S631_9AGAR|nr:uncharacterized protein MIND_01173600 [Mycena indigotica]KAF7292751.1 hypothetical protein MIND_01173600 [Mycena indigotica]